MTWNTHSFQKYDLRSLQIKIHKKKDVTQKRTKTSKKFYPSESEDVTQLAHEYGGYRSILNSLLILQS